MLADPSSAVPAAGRCDFCGAVNPAQSALCSGCGANRAGVATASAAIRANQSTERDAYRARLAAIEAETFARELSSGWRRFLVRLVLATLVVGALAVVAFVVGNSYIQQARAREERLGALAANAQNCAQAADAACARDNYLALLALDGAYAGAKDGLVRARLELAQQYSGERQFESALDEIDAVLQADSRNTAARASGRSVVDAWITQALDQGDWQTWLRLRQVREQRYSAI